jgi:hypothetical protein
MSTLERAGVQRPEDDTDLERSRGSTQSKVQRFVSCLSEIQWTTNRHALTFRAYVVYAYTPFCDNELCLLPSLNCATFERADYPCRFSNALVHGKKPTP